MQQQIKLAAAAIILAALSVFSPAQASVVTWNLNAHPGLLGTTQTFTVGTATITAAGFTDNTFLHTTALYGKNSGGDENGLGINSDPTGNHEIWGNTIIRIDMTAARSKGVTGFAFDFGSTTHGESWQVFGSNSATSGYASVFASNDELNHVLSGVAGSYAYYYVDRVHHVSDGNDNVLLASVGGVSAVPEASTWVMMIAGFAGLGLAAYRRKSKPALSVA